MSEEKYYTPTLEEFHIGFQYERLIKQWAVEEYEPYDDCLVGDVIGWIEDKKVRVKYLDREDIESLGWKLENIIDTWTFSYINPYKQLLRIFYHNDNIIRVEITNELGNVIFFGVIKNKSELKFIMKSLEIK